MKNAKSRIFHAALRLFADKRASQLAVSDLAKEAGLSRGTIYNNIDNLDALFGEICDLLYLELRSRAQETLADIDDPAAGVATIIRQHIRRVHDEPDWGRFVATYAMIEPRLGKFWAMEPAQLLLQGCDQGRFDFPQEQIHSVTTLGGGAMMGAISQVLQGVVTWRKSGNEIAELYLRSLGLDRDEAGRLARSEFTALQRMDFSDINRALLISDPTSA